MLVHVPNEGHFCFRLATRKSDSEEFAVKCIEDGGMSEEDKDALELEVLILREMNHPHIMTLEDYFLEVRK
jgi:hypothetical protein